MPTAVAVEQPKPLDPFVPPVVTTPTRHTHKDNISKSENPRVLSPGEETGRKKSPVIVPANTRSVLFLLHVLDAKYKLAHISPDGKKKKTEKNKSYAFEYQGTVVHQFLIIINEKD